MKAGAVIRGIGTASASSDIGRDAGLELARRANPGVDVERTETLYREARIANRTIVHDVDGLTTQILEPVDGRGRSTPERLAHYAVHAVDLGVRSCRQALHRADLSPAEVTHLVTVSCTGAETPGPWLGIQQTLGLASGLSRSHIGFMGCNAAINGLAVANAFARESPDHVVLMVCVEVCSIHYAVNSDSWDQQVANALFADGSAAAVVTRDGPGSRILCFGSHLFPDTSDLMSWRIGSHGFEMHLSPRVPIMLKRSIDAWLRPWLEAEGFPLDHLDHWAVHPGGRDILEGVRQGLGLSEAAIRPSLEILQRYGNMSSGTVLWIIDSLIRQAAPGRTLGLAFGPGLVGEAILLDG